MGNHSAPLAARRRRMGPRRPGDPLDASALEGLLQSLPSRQTSPRKIPARRDSCGDRRNRVPTYGASRSRGLKPPLFLFGDFNPPNLEALLAADATEN